MNYSKCLGVRMKMPWRCVLGIRKCTKHHNNIYILKAQIYILWISQGLSGGKNKKKTHWKGEQVNWSLEYTK